VKQTSVKNSAKTEDPVWCDECRVRIAPYEAVVADGVHRLHQHCFRKTQVRKSGAAGYDDNGLDLALA
jgi:hypothetical protein